MEFQFLTRNGREILETVKSKTKQRRQTIDDESPRYSPVDDNDEESRVRFDETRLRASTSRNKQPLGEHVSVVRNSNELKKNSDDSTSSIDASSDTTDDAIESVQASKHCSNEKLTGVSDL